MLWWDRTALQLKRAWSAEELARHNAKFTAPGDLARPPHEGLPVLAVRGLSNRFYGTFTVSDGYPRLSTNVPSGPFTPTNNAGSMDFGVFTNYAENHPNQSGGRAVNITNFIGNGATMGYMVTFTVCGWLNCADLEVGSGGNRIAYCLDQQNHGFDLVHIIGGSLKRGVNE